MSWAGRIGVTLAAFLAVRLDEDEAEANAQMAAVCPSCGSWGIPHACTGIHVVNTNALHPERVIREVEAKRAILAEHRPSPSPRSPGRCRVCASGAWVRLPLPCPTLRHLAAVYSGHPDYLDEWKP